MTSPRNGLGYELIMGGFATASKLLRHRVHLCGREHLEQLPRPVIFAVTHDSYFEVPALHHVYKGITPRPVFTIMAKEEFLNGRYLSTNFSRANPIIRSLFALIDRSGAPKAVFNTLHLISIPRPFADPANPGQSSVKDQIALQIEEFKAKISADFSSLIFPEGTTWGYGGLRKIRSAVFQLVHASYEHAGKKVFLLPINVKVDKLMKGYKDIFINIGRPEFVIAPKTEFNRRLFDTLQNLHTITFSQLGAFYLKKQSLAVQNSPTPTLIDLEQMTTHLQNAIVTIQAKIWAKVLPCMDPRLIQLEYIQQKLKQFVHFCVKHAYLQPTSNPKTYLLHHQNVLMNHPAKLFRKLNPLGFHANELASLGEDVIGTIFSTPDGQN